MRKLFKNIFFVIMLIICTIIIVSTDANLSIAEVNDAKRKNADNVIEGDNIIIYLNCGIDNCIKYGKNMNISATIQNDNGDFDGSIQIITRDDNKNIMYERDIAIANNEEKKFNMVIPINYYQNKIKFRIVDLNEKIIVDKDITIKMNNNYGYDTSYIGIISDNTTGFSYLQSTLTRKFTITDGDLTDDYLGYDVFDTIVINDYDTNKLTDAQFDAIKKWVENGGTLVVGTGENASKTLAKFTGKDSILNGKFGNLRKIKTSFGIEDKELEKLRQVLKEEEKRERDIEEQQNQEIEYSNSSYSKETSIDDIKDNDIEEDEDEEENKLDIKLVEKDIVDINIDGAVNAIIEDDNILMQKKSYGKGIIQVYSFDLSLEEINTTLKTAMRENIINNYSEFKKLEIDDYYNYDWNLENAISYIDNGKTPKTMRYVIVILIYIAITGPLLYFILKKLDKRNFLWGIIPIFSLIFTFVIYNLGSNTRISEPYMNYIRFLNYSNDNKADEEVKFSLTVPYNKKYLFKIPNSYNITPTSTYVNGGNYFISRVYYEEDENKQLNDYNVGIKRNNDDINITLKNYSSFSSVNFEANKTTELQGKLLENISITKDGKLKGSIKNEFGFDIEKSFIVLNGLVIPTSDIKEDDYVDLNEKETTFLSENSTHVDSEVIQKILEIYDKKDINEINRDSKTNRRKHILVYCIEKYLYNTSSNGYFIGFISDDDNSIESDINVEGYGEQLIVAPIDINYSNGKEQLIINIDKYYDSVDDGDYDFYYRKIYNMYNIIDYILPSDVNSIVYFENFNKRYDFNSYTGFTGEVQFYNYDTSNYDTIFVIDDEIEGSCNDLRPYLSEDNRLKVKYLISDKYEGYAMTLPVLSAIKEE